MGAYRIPRRPAFSSHLVSGVLGNLGTGTRFPGGGEGRDGFGKRVDRLDCMGGQISKPQHNPQPNPQNADGLYELRVVWHSPRRKKPMYHYFLCQLLRPGSGCGPQLLLASPASFISNEQNPEQGQFQASSQDRHGGCRSSLKDGSTIYKEEAKRNRKERLDGPRRCLPSTLCPCRSALATAPGPCGSTGPLLIPLDRDC